MESPQIHQFYDGRPHPAEDLNAMGVAILELVDEVNELRELVAKQGAKAPTTAAASKK